MSVTVSGLGSGLNYDSWIEELVALKQDKIDAVSAEVKAVGKQEKALATIESDYENLLTAIENFTTALSAEDVFNQKTVTSSSEAVTATVTAKASAQNVSVSVVQLATSTEAESTYNVASKASASSKLSSISDGAYEAGTFTLYVNGQANKLTLTSDSTLQDVLTSINGDGGSITGIEGVTATLEDGKLTISADSGYTVTVGSSSDTSNFSDLMSLTRNTETGAYSSSKTIFDTDTSGSITKTNFANSTGTDVQVTKGTFSIGDVEFTIDDSTSLDDIINDINKSDAGVTAAWDSNKGTLTLTSNEEGAINIDIEAGTSNFTDVMGLTNSSWTTTVADGSTTVTLDSTKLITDSQTLGTNAILTVNGTTITSSSNTVSSAVSGITGLTLTLNTTTSSAAKVSVVQDTTTIVNAITSLVNSYNTAISDTDEATATDGELYGESVLSSMRNKIRNLITTSIGGDNVYKTLASIGITTGAIGTSVNDDTNKLIINTEKLTAALEDNPDAVKKLLVGDSTSNGVLNKIQTVLENATDATKGYFTTREDSYEKKIGRLNDKVEKMTDDLDKYRTQLEAKFSVMDELISSLESNASIFDSYFNSKSKD